MSMFQKGVIFWGVADERLESLKHELAVAGHLPLSTCHNLRPTRTLMA